MTGSFHLSRLFLNQLKMKKREVETTTISLGRVNDQQNQLNQHLWVQRRLLPCNTRGFFLSERGHHLQVQLESTRQRVPVFGMPWFYCCSNQLRQSVSCLWGIELLFWSWREVGLEGSLLLATTHCCVCIQSCLHTDTGVVRRFWGHRLGGWLMIVLFDRLFVSLFLATIKHKYERFLFLSTRTTKRQTRHANNGYWSINNCKQMQSNTKNERTHSF